MLNLLFTEAEQKGRTRDFRVVIGPGSDGSSTDKLSLDLGFNPWDTAITHRSEWHSVSKTVFTQYDPSGSWCTEQSDVWLDDVKTFYHRPIRCAPNIHPRFPAQWDTDLLAEHSHLSCAKTCIDVSSFSPDLYKDKHATLNGRQKKEISSSETFCHRNEASLAEFVDQHHFVWSNSYVHEEEFRDWCGQESSWISPQDIGPPGRTDRNQLTIYR